MSHESTCISPAVARICFGACQNDADFATPGFGVNNSLVPSVPDDTFPALAACTKVYTEHDLAGNGRLIGTYSSWLFGPQGTYEVTATGTAISDPLKAGETSLRFMYQINNQTVEGFMQTTFENGAILQQPFSGTAQRNVDGKVMTLTLNLGSATLLMDGETLHISEGMIILQLPAIPIGAFEISVQTNGVYCTID